MNEGRGSGNRKGREKKRDCREGRQSYQMLGKMKGWGTWRKVTGDGEGRGGFGSSIWGLAAHSVGMMCLGGKRMLLGFGESIPWE